MRTFAALLLLGFLAVANAQIYTNYFGGKMSRSDQTGVTGFGRYDPARDEWYETAGVERATGSSVVDVETHNGNNNLIYTITSTGTTSNVLLYDAENVAWTQMGETFSGSAEDLLVNGNDMYLCGSFTGRVSSLAYRTVDAPSRTLWTNTHADGKTVPSCSRVFAFTVAGLPEKRIVMLSGGQLMWKLPNGDWSSDASAITSNLRTSTNGVAISVNAANCKMFDGYLYIYSQSGFILTTDSTTVHHWLRSSDGINFNRVLRLDDAHSGVSAGAWHPNVGGTVMYYLSTLSVTAKNNYLESGLFRADIGSDFARIGTRIGSYIDTSFTGARVYVLRSMADQIVVTFPTTNGVKFYRDPADYPYPVGFNNLAAFRHIFTINSPVVKIRTDGANDWLPALGGGFGGTNVFLRDNHDNTMIYAGGDLSSVFNTYTRGVSAWDDETKRFVSIGNPLSDSPGFSPYNAITPSVRTMQVWRVGDSQAVVVGGTFARINNVTVNSLAYIRTSDVNADVLISPWKALVQNGEAGVTQRDDDAVLGSSANFIAGPGAVDNSIAIPSRNNGDSRRVFITGYFSRSGDVDSRNVAAFEIDPVANSVEFLALQGGVSGSVHAIDAVGRKVFVGGDFKVAGNVSAYSIAMWDDDQSKWFALGTGVQGVVRAISSLGGNRLLVAGTFTIAGGVSVKNVAVWDIGSEQWEAIPCERCSSTCESEYPSTWFVNGALCDSLILDEITNIERAGDKLLLAMPGNSVYLWFDERAKIVRKWNPNNAMHPDIDEQVYSRTFMPAPSGSKTDTWALVETNVDNDVTYFAELDSKSGNTYKFHRGGFDARVYTVSSANSLAFASMGMLVLIALIALLF